MSTATDGRRIEHLVRDDLLALGYMVLRAAGSKGAADLIALKHYVVVVQVKRTNALLSPGSRRRLLAMADAVGLKLGIPVVATKPLRKPIDYRLLTGPGPADWLPWTPREVPDDAPV